MQNVKIQILDERATFPEYQTEGAAAFDLAILEDTVVAPGTTVKAPLGLIIQAPKGHFLLTAPRSSTYKRWGITLGNTIGIVDEDFCGPEDELCLMLHRERTDHILRGFSSPPPIPAGTRLAQGMFIPVTQGFFIPQDEPIVTKTRGGWGSTG